MVAFTPDFITCNSSDPGNIPVLQVNILPFLLMNQPFLVVLAHINHIRSIVGIDGVGIGSDFDGIETYVFSSFRFRRSR